MTHNLSADGICKNTDFTSSTMLNHFSCPALPWILPPHSFRPSRRSTIPPSPARHQDLSKTLLADVPLEVHRFHHLIICSSIPEKSIDVSSFFTLVMLQLIRHWGGLNSRAGDAIGPPKRLRASSAPTQASQRSCQSCPSWPMVWSSRPTSIPHRCTALGIPVILTMTFGVAVIFFNLRMPLWSIICLIRIKTLQPFNILYNNLDCLGNGIIPRDCRVMAIIRKISW